MVRACEWHKKPLVHGNTAWFCATLAFLAIVLSENAVHRLCSEWQVLLFYGRHGYVAPVWRTGTVLPYQFGLVTQVRYHLVGHLVVVQLVSMRLISVGKRSLQIGIAVRP